MVEQLKHIELVDPDDAGWVRFMIIEELEKGRDSGELKFVDEFFEDIKLALDLRTSIQS